MVILILFLAISVVLTSVLVVLFGWWGLVPVGVLILSVIVALWRALHDQSRGGLG